ncbi:hypothetical protein A5707_16400 [Mycobacterium kyorinense]|uniref:Uncharacterized protein n=1 Tax=Mycobacterium kyorinense TaxID=487514 RepID=A0A1A2ZGR1_9MYCO|nr:hypothetical protein [Mycobacterium kyorinense]OBI49794.1 hypothetical protein A5707_16400 [Mycobacterium kyorinense]
MAKLRLLPHRTADSASVTFGDWWIERDAARVALPHLLGGWDYASKEIVGLSLTIDEDLFLESTGLRDLGDVEVLLVGDCKDSQVRVVSRHSLEARAPVCNTAFDLALPAGQLAGSLTLMAIIVLARNLPRTGDRIPYLRGARLISSKATVVALEGEASRFPTEPAAFSRLYLPDAPWTLQITYESLDASFMGGVRLLVNTEHPVGRMLLDGATAARVSGIAMADVIRLLVASVSDHTEDLESTDHEEGSVAYVLGNMCEFYLGRELAAAIRLYQTEPLQFDRLLHERIKPLTKVFE